MVNIDYTIFIQVINLLVLLWLLNFLLFRPIRSILNERSSQLGSLKADISKMEQDVEQTIFGLEEGIKAARLKGKNEKDILKNQGYEEEKSIIDKTTMEVDARINELKGEIVREVENAKNTLKDHVALFSREMAVKILGRDI